MCRVRQAGTRAQNRSKTANTHTHARTQGQAVLARLMAAVGRLPHLEQLNGCRAPSAAALVSAVTASGVLDLSGSALGPVASGVLLGACGGA